MIINDAPKNEPVMGNVGQIGEFRIRNSAKAFNILSSGLYANKIRAIIRELSCNAVDSHVAAGRADTPFDVHLPTSLEPYFSIRDYGTGLNHDQVTNIYTTYFESTKTESNDFIGALGLGSKSPFSYTDNFTVTAIKDGRKGIYTAFINENGVPSIAMMMEEATEEPSGVEVKFSVNDRWDFGKFQEEARYVYRYFKLLPVVSGPDFVFSDNDYETQDIIPGVHSLKSRSTRAVMGNIAYPIDVPNASTTLGELHHLLNCNLEMHFAIGELDFQASREGLSYIPETIEAIKAKLEQVNSALAVVLAKEADAIKSHWERSEFLLEKTNSTLWRAAVVKYVVDTKFKLLDISNTSYIRRYDYKITVDQLAKKYNINVTAFTKSPHEHVCSTLKPNHTYDAATQKHVSVWHIPVYRRMFFVVNDTKIGALERAKYHWRKGGAPEGKSRNDTVMVLQAANKAKPAEFDRFLKAIRVPSAQVLKASGLKEKPRAGGSGSGLGANVSIMKLAQRGYGGYYKEREMVWKDAGKADSFEAGTTYYYLPLKGFEIQTQGAYIGDVKRFLDDIKGCGLMPTIEIYGVRKSDHKWVSGQTNWVNIQTHLVELFSKIDTTILRKLIAKDLDMKKQFRYNNVIANQVTATSPYLKFVEEFKDTPDTAFNRESFNRLARDYKGTVDIEAIVTSIQDDLTAVKNRYPLLSSLKDYDVNSDAVAQYINLIDKEV